LILSEGEDRKSSGKGASKSAGRTNLPEYPQTPARIFFFDWHQPGHCSTATGDNDLFTQRHTLEQPREMSFRLMVFTVFMIQY